MSNWTNKESKLLFIFDLDDTLIPQHGMFLFNESKYILNVLYPKVNMCIASFNDDTLYYLDKNKVSNYFECIEGYYKNTKHQHITNILKQYPNIPYENIYFFDDSKENIEYISKEFNIHSCKVNSTTGLTFYDIIDILLNTKEKLSKHHQDDIQSIITDLFINETTRNIKVENINKVEIIPQS